MKSIILASVATLTLSVASAMAQNAPATSPQSGGATADNGQFIVKETLGEFRAPKLIGVSVYDNNNKSIGKISDLLLDKDGQVKAVVIGIGGFLGIDQKDVAVPYSAVHWQTEQRTVATNAGPASSTTMGGNAGGLGSTMTNENAPGTMNGNPPGGPAGTAANGSEPGTMGGATTNGTAPGTMANNAGAQTRTATITPAETATYQGYPDRAVIDMSQAQLKSAPEFKYASNPANKAMNAAASDNGTMAPGGTNGAQKP